MEFNIRKEGVVTVFSLAGRLDGVTAPVCEERLRELIDGGSHRIVLDFEELRYISSAGLRTLLTTANWLKEKDGKLCLAGVKGNVKAVLDMCKLTDLFQVEDTAAAGVAALA